MFSQNVSEIVSKLESVIKLKRKIWLEIVNEMHEVRRCTEARGSSLFTLSFAAGRAAGTSCALLVRQRKVKFRFHITEQVRF